MVSITTVDMPSVRQSLGYNSNGHVVRMVVMATTFPSDSPQWEHPTRPLHRRSGQLIMFVSTEVLFIHVIPPVGLMLNTVMLLYNIMVLNMLALLNKTMIMFLLFHLHGFSSSWNLQPLEFYNLGYLQSTTWMPLSPYCPNGSR